MIYFDEAGNTGSNLLDKSQPTYVLLSHDYTLEECEALLSPILSISNADEIHFKRLRKYKASRRAVLECINDPRIVDSRVFHYACDKQFMVVTHIVDQLIELSFYHSDMDIYKGGLNLSTANMLYILGNNCWDKQLFEKMCAQFVIWIRSNKNEDALVFYRIVDDLYDSIRDMHQRELIWLILQSKYYLKITTESHNKYKIDPTLPCFISHCNFWAEKYNRHFDITFDNSKQISYWEDVIDFLTHQLPSASVGYGSRKQRYPLLINNLITVDSNEDLAIQMADVFASSLNYAYGNIFKGIDDDFSNQILASKLEQTSRMAIWPSMDVTPESLGMTEDEGISPLEYLVKNGLKFKRTN